MAWTFCQGKIASGAFRPRLKWFLFVVTTFALLVSILMRAQIYEGSKKIGLIFNAKFNITKTEVEGDFDGILPFKEGQQMRPLQVWINGRPEMIQAWVITYPERLRPIHLRGASAKAVDKRKNVKV